MSNPTIIPYLVNHPEKQKTALILLKHISYESRALKHMIKNATEMSDVNAIIKQAIRITCQMALVTSLMIAYKDYHKYLFGGVVTYFWAEPIGNGMYKIPSHGQKLLTYNPN